MLNKIFNPPVLKTIISFQSKAITPQCSFLLNRFIATQSEPSKPIDKYLDKSKYRNVVSLPPGTIVPESGHIKLKNTYKRAGHLLLQLNQEAVAKSTTTICEFRAGDIIEIVMKSRLGKPEGDKVMGMVLARRNKGINSSFIIRSGSDENDTFEMTMPLYSPDIQEIRMVQSRAFKNGQKRVKHSKLLFLRDKPIGQYYHPPITKRSKK